MRMGRNEVIQRAVTRPECRRPGDGTMYEIDRRTHCGHQIGAISESGGDGRTQGTPRSVGRLGRQPFM